MRTNWMVFWMLVLLLLPGAAMGSANASKAESRAAVWAKIERLRPGQTIRVLCSDERTWTGRLASAAADGLMIDAGGIERKKGRSEIREVQVKSRGVSALAGLGIGAVAGVGIGFAVGSGLKGGEKTTTMKRLFRNAQNELRLSAMESARTVREPSYCAPTPESLADVYELLKRGDSERAAAIADLTGTVVVEPKNRILVLKLRPFYKGVGANLIRVAKTGGACYVPNRALAD